jgi:Zn-dependent peptidase ImmA (M78 family)
MGRSEFLIIERFGETAPVDVTALAEALGLAVWEDEEIPLGISGKLYKDPEDGGPSGYSIAVRASDPYVRRRFTVAHEIAHFVLHRDRVGASLTDDEFYRSNLSSWDEVDANLLAADILIPSKLLVKYVGMRGDDLATLASIFKVSEAAMRIRLEANSSTPIRANQR